MLPIIQQSGIV